mgnify:FL=1
MKRKLAKPKSVNNYTENDVIEFFYTLYSQYFGNIYPRRHFKRLDIKKVKLALDTYGTYNVLGSMYNAMDKNGGTLNIPYWFSGLGLGYYLPDEEPEIYFVVRSREDREIRSLWDRYKVLNAVWFPTAKTEAEKKDIKQKLEGYVRNA